MDQEYDVPQLILEQKQGTSFREEGIQTIIEEVDEEIEGGGGGGSSSILTEHYSDIESLTYYYYGYKREGEWEMIRNTIGDVATEGKATEVNNPSITDLNNAIANRVTLTYATN